jgi:two-component sensor histidine kinase
MPRIGRTFSVRTATTFLGNGIVAIAAALVVLYREYKDRIGSSQIAVSRAIMPRIERTFSIRTATRLVGSSIVAIGAASVVLYRKYRNRIGSGLIAASRAIMPRTERTFSIRTAMLVLTVGSGIVAIATALVMGWLSYRDYRNRIGTSLIAASRAIMISIDGELDQALAFVDGLSTSPNFVKGDFAALQVQAREALAPYGYVLILKSADGQQGYVNTHRPPRSVGGVRVSGRLEPGSAESAYLRRVEDRWLAMIDVPIEDQNGQRVYTMVVGVPIDVFQEVLRAQHLPPNWSPVVLDKDWVIVARGLNPEKFIGQKGAGEEFRDAPTNEIHELRVLEGAPSLAAYSHSSSYGWTTAVATSETNILEMAFRPALLAAIGGFLASGLLIVLAAFLSTYLAAAIRKLAGTVEGFPESTVNQTPTFRLRELSLVAQALNQAAVTVRAELENMRRLNELSTVLMREENTFETCCDEIVGTAIAVSGADKGNLQHFDETSGSLRIVAQRGFRERCLKFFDTVDDHAAASCGTAMATNEQVIVDDVLTSKIFLDQPAQKVLLDAEVRAVISSPLRSSKGNLLGVLSTHFSHPGHPSERQIRLTNIVVRQAADYLERKQSEQIQQTIVLELQHRANNLLAVIQSIAQRSLAGDQGKKAFEARLQALARANRALVRSNWGGVDLNQLVRSELEVFSQRAAIAGVSVLLSPQHAQNFALALHELATNSAKYGALSGTKGNVRVSWTIEPDQSGSVLKFRWQESGGPPVSPPTRQGFGSQLLTGIFSDVTLEYPVGGLRCEIEVRLVPASRRVSSERSQTELSLHDDAVVDG